MNTITFIIGALAAFRLSWLVTQDVITEPIRSAIQEWAMGPYGDGWHPWRARLSYLSTCVACSSIWTGTLVAVSYYYLPTNTWMAGATALAFSGVAVMFAETIDVLRHIAAACRKDT